MVGWLYNIGYMVKWLADCAILGIWLNGWLTVHY